MHPKKRILSGEAPSSSKRSTGNDALVRQQDKPPPVGSTIDLAIKMIINALKNEQYDTAISQSTLAIIHLSRDADNFIKQNLIELRATAYERKGQTRQELEDALRLIQISPQNVCGYLRAAKLHSLQGRQTDAIEVLKQGYLLVVEEEQRALLQEQAAVINAQLRHHIDFIAESPYDILCNILGRIDIDCVLMCANVSKAWRNRMLQCPVPWKVIQVSNGGRWRNPEILGQFMSTISQHVEELTIKCKTRLMVQYIKLLTVHIFPRLRFLHIYDDSRNGVDISDSLYKVLPYIANTLTELQINMRFITTISLKRILSTCRKLTAINLFVRQISEVYECFSLSHPTALVSVTLLAQDGIRTVSNFETLFQYSPNLRFFNLHYCEEDIIPIIADHCPNLKALRTSLVNLDDVPQYYKNTSPEMDTKGLELLVLGGIRSALPLSPRLEASQNTLKYICLAPVGGSSSTIIDWQPLTWYHMPQVAYFYIWMERCPVTFREQLPAILRCYPNLKTLRLESWCNIISEPSPAPVLSDVYRTVIEMNHLERLGLVRIDIQSDSFSQLMLHYSTRYHKLRILEIRSCVGLTPATLLQIAKIKSLEDLSFGVLPEHTIAPSIITESIRLLTELPHLSVLLFEDMNLTIEDVKNLVKCRNLWRLWMHDVSLPREGMDILEDAIQDFHLFSSDD